MSDTPPPIVPVPLVPDFVEVGEFTYMGPDVRFYRWIETEKIIIGKYGSIAGSVRFAVGGNHHTGTVSTYPFDNLFLNRPNPTRTYRTTRPTIVGHDVWIGNEAYICSGAKVGHGSVVGARAVVRGDVPPYAIVVGNPATIVRYRFSADIIERLLRISWWDWPREKAMANVEWFYRPITEFLDHFEQA